jgi:hypothetical protein
MGTYEKGKSRIPDFFDVQSSDRPDERFSELTPMGKFQAWAGSVPYDGASQGYDVTATHLQWALGVQIERALYDDDQFGVIDEQFGALGDSAFKTHEDHAAGLFTQSFVNVSTFYSHTEAVALCSNSHTTTVPGVATTTGFDNLITAELSPVSLTAAVIQMRGFKDAAGDIIDNTPDRLLVPVALRDRADEILQTTKGLDDANENVNVHAGRFAVVDWYRLTDPNDWWLMDSAGMKKNALWFWRVKLELSKMESFDQLIAKARGYQRYSYLRRDWRWLIGSQVT